MLVLLDVRASDEIRENLLALGFDVLSVPKNSRLDEPVAAHPDMRFFTLGNKIFISKEEKDELSYVTAKLEALGYEIIYSSVSLSKKYPADIAFNCYRGQLSFRKPSLPCPRNIGGSKKAGLYPYLCKARVFKMLNSHS